MALSTQPPAVVAQPLSAGEFLAKFNDLFADNEYQNIVEQTFRTLFADLVDAFVTRRELNVRLVKGATFPVPYTDSLGLIPPAYRVLGMQAVARFGAAQNDVAAGFTGPPAYFELQRYSAGDVDALADENPATTATVKARWVRISGTEAEIHATFDAWVEEDQDYDEGDVLRYAFAGGVSRLIRVKQALHTGRNPRPTGLFSDPYYEYFTPNPANDHAQNTDAGTERGEFAIRLNSANREPGLGRTVLVFEGRQGGPKAALGFRFRNADDTPAAALEQCLNYTAQPGDAWSGISAGALLAANNLNDLTDPAVARQKLGVGYVRQFANNSLILGDPSDGCQMLGNAAYSCIVHGFYHVVNNGFSNFILGGRYCFIGTQGTAQYVSIKNSQYVTVQSGGFLSFENCNNVVTPAGLSGCTFTNCSNFTAPAVNGRIYQNNLDVTNGPSGGGNEPYQATNDSGTGRFCDVVLTRAADSAKRFAQVALVNAAGWQGQVLKTTDATSWGPVRTAAADLNADLTAAWGDASAPAALLLRVSPAPVQDASRLAYLLFAVS